MWVMNTVDGLADSLALKANLEQTAAEIEIPAEYYPLLESIEDYFGVHKRVKELLIELNHPFVNWEFVADGIKAFSVNDFTKFNEHSKAVEAINLVFEIYFTILKSDSQSIVKDKALRFLFDFICTMLSESGDKIERSLSLIEPVFDKLLDLCSEKSDLLRKCSSFIKPLFIHQRGLELTKLGNFDKLATMAFTQTYDHWLSIEDTSEWFNRESFAGLTTSLEPENEEQRMNTLKELVYPLSHESLRNLSDKISDLNFEEGKEAESLAILADTPDYNQILNAFIIIADEIERKEEFGKIKYLVKLDFLFNILGSPNLEEIHSTALQEINRSLSLGFKEEEEDEDREKFIKKIFSVLRDCTENKGFCGMLLNSMLTMAKEIVELDNEHLLNVLIDEIIACGFQHPEVTGANEEWQIQANPNHIKNVRVWMEIIALKPAWTRKLLSALIINLTLGGVLVKDTDLFQRDISAYLNAGLSESENLSKQLLRLFPVFFNEIGAEGELREVSTRADELGLRQDKLVHFIRKVSHVESNNLLVEFLEQAFECWAHSDKSYIKSYVPTEVYDQLDPNCEYFHGLHLAFSHLLYNLNKDTDLFLNTDLATMKEILEESNASERDKDRAYNLVRMYQLLSKKYNPQPIDLIEDLKNSNLFELDQLMLLDNHVKNRNYRRGLELILQFKDRLTSIILSEEKTVATENIYFKRHIAAGIPSMYGVYKEEKFDALGLSLRLESLGTAIFEQLIQELELNFITKSTIIKILSFMPLFLQALQLEGIPPHKLSTKVNMLQTGTGIKLFSIDQYHDIFISMSRSMEGLIKEYYIDTHRDNFKIIMKQLINKGHSDFKDYDPNDKTLIFKLSENFLRNQLTTAFMLQSFDTFITRIMNSLQSEVERFRNKKAILTLLTTYNADITVTQIHDSNPAIDNQILLGNKAHWLKRLASFNFPIPRGFVVTTEVYRCAEAIIGYKNILKNLYKRIQVELCKLERTTGKRFGCTKNPLLLSVRSGAAISMPGMMDTFLNVGINREICEGLSENKEHEWSAWDCYRRFLQTLGMNEGLDRNFFDQIIENFKTKFSVSKKFLFTPAQMREIALTYYDEIRRQGIRIPNKPEVQLEYAINRTFKSWNSERARLYRRQMNISDEWGTAVTIQSMVFGNLNEESGSGVTFTREPDGPDSEIKLFGDFFFGVQGEDIVSGLIETYPISELQRIKEHRNSDISLESHFPDVYERLLELATELIKRRGFSHQEIEFTFENSTKDGLFILQTREQFQEEESLKFSFKNTPELHRQMKGSGVGISGGALAGRAVFSEKEIEKYKDADPYVPLILIRPDTVPEDVHLLLQVDGLLTARGGRTSHAAVTVPQLKKVGVVGFNRLKVYETESYCFIGSTRVRAGDFISIDGRSGSVYIGLHEPDDS